MNKNLLAKGILLIAEWSIVASFVGLIGYAFYEKPFEMAGIVGGLGIMCAVAWAIDHERERRMFGDDK